MHKEIRGGEAALGVCLVAEEKLGHVLGECGGSEVHVYSRVGSFRVFILCLEPKEALFAHGSQASPVRLVYVGCFLIVNGSVWPLGTQLNYVLLWRADVLVRIPVRGVQLNMLPHISCRLPLQEEASRPVCSALADVGGQISVPRPAIVLLRC